MTSHVQIQFMTRSGRGSVRPAWSVARMAGFALIAAVLAVFGVVAGHAGDSSLSNKAPKLAEAGSFAPMRPLLNAVSGTKFLGGNAAAELVALANGRKDFTVAGVPAPKAAAIPGFTIPAPLVYSGPKLGPYLRENPHFNESGETLRGPRAALIAVSDRSALESEYSARLLERDALLPQADKLDLRELTITEDHNSLRETAIALVSDIEQYVSAGKPANRWPGLAARVKTFDAAVLALEAEKKTLPPDWDSFTALVAPWVQKAATLVQRVRAVFARVPQAGQCVLEEIERNSEGRAFNCRARCNRGGSIEPYEYRPFNTGKPCGVDVGGSFVDPKAGLGILLR